MAFSFFKKPAANKEEQQEKKSASVKYHTLKVREVVRETSDAISIVFEQPEEKIKYKPGQFFTLIPSIEGKKVRRAYSVCTSPFVDPHPAVTVKRVEGGLVSNFLNDTLKAGDMLEVMEPMGVFTVEPQQEHKRHVILLGGGSGITPLMSIAKSVLHMEPDSQVSLIYANRNEDSIIFKSKLDELEKKYGERFHITHILEQEPVSWICPTGLLKPELLKQLLNKLPESAPEYTEYYMCGPEGMMVNVEETLKELQIPKQQVHRESFVAGKNEKVEGAADPVKAAGDDVPKSREVTVILDGEEHKFTVEPDKTILETALELDIDLPYSCQSGLCTACRGKCLSGKVKLDEEEGLSESEIDEGYVLTCVGHPLTDDVVIEIG
jgi:ring-1,2-phenylacetyl-CoA epoxidase subunit PaaE